MRNRISSERWEQIKVAYAAGVNLREIARKMNIPEGTILSHAKRRGWTQQLRAATDPLTVVQSNAITALQSVSESLAAILSERKERTKLGLSKYAAEAAEQAGEHPDKLLIAGKVKDVASVHSTLWPEAQARETILNLAVLTGLTPGRTGIVSGRRRSKRERLGARLPKIVLWHPSHKVHGRFLRFENFWLQNSAMQRHAA